MKKFIKKLVADVKFSDAGTGHRLNEERAPRPSSSAAPVSAPRRPPSADAQSAGAAALARLEAANNRQSSGMRAQQLELRKQMQVCELYFIWLFSEGAYHSPYCSCALMSFSENLAVFLPAGNLCIRSLKIGSDKFK